MGGMVPFTVHSYLKWWPGKKPLIFFGNVSAASAAADKQTRIAPMPRFVSLKIEDDVQDNSKETLESYWLNYFLTNSLNCYVRCVHWEE